MQYTNKAGLPQPLVNALSHDPYQKLGDYSCTELLNPPRLTHLFRRHEPKIVVDVMDNMWSMFGRAMHEIAATGATDHSIIEQGFILNITTPSGKSISVGFHPDHIWKEEDGIYQMMDFKNTSYHTVKGGRVKSDWEKQLNMYGYGMRQRGFDIKKLWLAALLRDWSWTECHVKQLRDYPQYPIMVFPITMWADSYTHQLIVDRVVLHEQAKSLPDDKLPECTEEERWAKISSWAVVYTKGKAKGRAVSGGASFRKRAEAVAFQNEHNTKKGFKTEAEWDTKIEFRMGESVRCERYCPVKNFCSQYKQMHKRKDPF